VKYILVVFLLLAVPVLASTQKTNCEMINGLDAIDKHRFIMFGEQHGTVEIPQRFGDMVCHAAVNTKGKVAILLELPVSLQENLNGYFDGKVTQQQFLSHLVWSPKWQDGRYSVAMLSLIDRLKSYRQLFPNKIDVFLVDLLPENAKGKSKAEYMAENILGHVKDDHKKILSFSGNFHNRVNVPSGSSVASLLEHLEPFTLTVKANKGSYWACTGPTPDACKLNQFDKKQPPKYPEGVIVLEQKSQWHGVYIFHELTASAPAIQSQSKL